MYSKNVTFSSFLLLIIFSLFLNVTSVDIECQFRNENFNKVLDQYSCIVQNDLKIYDANVAIDSVLGTHEEYKSNEDVTGISIMDKKIHYMPTNLGEKFKNLIAIQIKEGRLKEIRQSDIKAFSKLRHLDLDENDIETLDNDLFKFNPLLETIWLENNKINSIGYSTLSQLKSLKSLDLIGNVCIAIRTKHSYQIATNMYIIREQCPMRLPQQSTVVPVGLESAEKIEESNE